MENILRTFDMPLANTAHHHPTLADGNGKLLITGGGAFIKFLIGRIDLVSV